MLEPILKAFEEFLTQPSAIGVWARACENITQLSHKDLDAFAERLTESQAQRDDKSEFANFDRILQQAVQQIIRREQVVKKTDRSFGWTDDRLEIVNRWYLATPQRSVNRNLLLCWLATAGTDATRELWTDLICSHPPHHRSSISIAFGPMMNDESPVESDWLKRLFEHGINEITIAPAIIELCNYYFRKNKIEDHPALARAAKLTELLGQLVGQLGKIEEGELKSVGDAQTVSLQVADSVSMIVALSDFFGLVKYENAIGKLNHAINLRHRRVQTEAAAALARLGDAAGTAALIKLAEEPIARLRVLAFAEELGILNSVSLEFQGEISKAESRLAIWLAEPTQMGLAPSSLDLVDNREMYWPSYEHPVQCFLFRFEYGKGENCYSNVAICGPLSHAFPADITHLAVEDMYAAFAGWQTIHDEIFQLTVENAQTTFSREYGALEQVMKNVEPVSILEVQSAGRFFGELVLIARAEKDGLQGTLLIEKDQTSFIAAGNESAPIDGQLAYAIWRGRRLLETFNRA